MTTIETLAPAKINLTLHVTGRRPDGYHLLDSLVVFAGVGDHITARSGPGLSFMATGPFGGAVPMDGSNLVLRAADLMAGTSGRGATLTLEKNLPPASGIGGGSADAAATLRGLADLWHQPLPDREALLSLGADVPVCMTNTPQHMRGIGEDLTPVTGLPPLFMVLATPRVPVPTPQVFAALDGAFGAPMPPRPVFPRPYDFIEWLATCRNDLEGPACALAPEIDDTLFALRHTPDCLLARMSGSGATCFGLYPDAEARERAARMLSSENPDWWVAEG
ncbi:4-(cytidine 5'-diphospho)-2-C-methyl-D-erythritol kinase [Alphaproteobacteria bacterium KMM 3653]|uniref:4-diphosphocytidyl-2-C-methyl-D-erythritol kinase n=1 Tax=Harenicola maris TaxID=2841044 RepID=A0AAP2CTK3_9RHOB|nr:4-(cytidine 5'-diphospho)-2-C-methyl-D-erythritol kinase [Harenicola maris]